MGFGEAVSTCFKQYVGFSGRARRSEYWYWALFTIFAYIGIGFIALQAGEIVGLIAHMALWLPSLAVSVRRLHDIDKSGWWFLIGFVPIIGSILLIFWFVRLGTEGPNRFGDDPIGATPLDYGRSK